MSDSEDEDGAMAYADTKNLEEEKFFNLYYYRDHDNFVAE